MSECLEETGEVIAVSDGYAKVLLRRHSSCDKCGACGMGKKPELIVEVDNKINAKKGDLVLIRMQAGQLFKAAFLMYTIPLFMLIIGFLIGQKLSLDLGKSGSSAENFGILTGFIFLTFSYLSIRWWDRRQQIGNKIRPQLIEIIGSVENALNMRQK